jgi:hydrogenase nickel incorporation protein HypA/HybF
LFSKIKIVVLYVYLAPFMHELSVAIGIVNIAEKETQKANKSRVELIELEIGSLSGIELDSLEYIWEVAVKGTVLEGAIKKIDFIEGQANCLECETSFKVENVYDNCPTCKSYFKDIIKGKELRVKFLEVS